MAEHAELYIDREEFAQVLGVHPTLVDRFVEAGFPSVSRDGRRQFRASDVVLAALSHVPQRRGTAVPRRSRRGGDATES